MNNQKHTHPVTLSDLQGGNQQPAPQVMEEAKVVTPGEIGQSLSKVETKPDPTKIPGSAIIGDLSGKFDSLLENIEKANEEIVKKYEDEIIEEDMARAREARLKRSENPETMDDILLEDDEKPKSTIEMEASPISFEMMPGATSEIETKFVIPESDDKGMNLELSETKPEVIDEEDDEDLVNEEGQDVFSELREIVSEKIKSSSKTIDLSKFTINKKTISSSNAFATSKEEVYSWVLSAAEEVISLKQFKGDDIDALIEKDSENMLAERSRIFKTIYSHIYNPKKTYMEWLKSLLFFDQDDLFFAIYKASFSGSNFVPYQCEKCKKTFVSDNLPMDKLVKYKNEEAERKLKDIIKSGEPKPENREVSLEVVSDRFVVGIKMPTVFDISFAYSVLNEAFLEKYQAMLTINSFIDSIYVINEKDSTLDPIDFKIYPDNLGKTVRARIKKVSMFIQSLSIDEYNELKSIVEKYTNKFADRDLSYVIPATTCPKCGQEIKEEPISAQNLLFIRHQLTGPNNG